MPISYYFIPLVTGLIGWVTNVIAVKMLFHPREPLSLGFMTLQGVVPKRKAALASSMADIFDRELLSVGELVEQFNEIDLEGEGAQLLDERLDVYIERIKGRIPMAAMFLNDQVSQTLKEEAQAELIKMVPDIKERIANGMHTSFDLKGFIEEKIRSFSVRKLEQITLHVATKELKTIELLGGALGLLIGLIQVAFMLYCC